MLRFINNKIGISAVLLGLMMGSIPFISAVQAQKFFPPTGANYQQPQSEISGKVPRLIKSWTTDQSPGAPATYYFMITVPNNSPNALKAVTITQRTGTEAVAFTVNQSRAFVGNTLGSSVPVALTPIGGEQPKKTGDETLVFEQPVQPGNSVIIALKVDRNPQDNNNYSFGVTAFPDNENSPNLYLGAAMFHVTGH